MAKLTLSDLSSLQNDTSAIAAINANNALIEDAMNSTLFREGSLPNEMEASLDMNSNRILNLPEPSSVNEPLRLQDLEDFVGGTLSLTIVPGEDIVLLATGQSELRSIWAAHTWEAPDNAYVWNWVDGADDDDSSAHVPFTGSAFVQLSGDINKQQSINVADKICADVARKYPNNNVYLINIALAGAPITCWKTGAVGLGFADIYTDIQTNVEMALGILGKSTLNGMVWYQGTTPVTDAAENYQTDFETVMNRFNAETWFPRTTPIVIVGLRKEISDFVGTLFTEQTNSNLLAASRAENNRKFVDPNFLPTAYWDSNVHPNADGVDALGSLIADALIDGSDWETVLESRDHVLTNAVISKPAARNLFSGGNFTANRWPYGISFPACADGTSILEKLTWVQTGAGIITVEKAAAAPTFTQCGTYTANSLEAVATTADAVGDPDDYYGFEYLIDGSLLTHLGFGQSQDSHRRKMAVSFWVFATKSGSYSLVFQNSDRTRSWVQNYTLAGSTWTKVTAVIPVCEDGTWPNTFGTTGLRVLWTIQTTAPYLTFDTRTWVSDDVRGGATQVIGFETINNVFRIALPQIEEGPISSGFDNGISYLSSQGYTEGTFTPGISIGDRTKGIVYGTQYGTFTKIGNRVFYNSFFQLSNKGKSTITFTGAGSPNVLLTAHGFSIDDAVYFTTTGALPVAITANTTYYVRTVPNANTFTVAAKPVSGGGSAINMATTGSGTHSVNLRGAVKITGLPYPCAIHGTGSSSGYVNLSNASSNIVLFFAETADYIFPYTFAGGNVGAMQDYDLTNSTVISVSGQYPT